MAGKINVNKTQQKSGAARTATRTTRPAASVAAKKTVAKRVPVRPAKTVVKPAPKAAASPARMPPVASVAMKKSKADKSVKPKKAKMVRDSFTMPEPEYKLIAAVKQRCVARGFAAKKSEVLRAAVIGFAAQSDAAITAALKALAVIKTGRPPEGRK